MESLILKPTKSAPAIVLDSENNVFEFSRTSIMPNARDFYEPINRWIEEYGKKPNVLTLVKFDFDFLNSGSVKEILQVLSKFEKIGQHYPVKIQWYYRKDDHDMLTTSLRYDQILELDMEFHPF